jgi:integrase
MPIGRRRLVTGIYRDTHGLAAVVAVGGRQLEKRFPVGTPLREMQDWRERTRVDALDDPRPERGTFAADVRRYTKLAKSLIVSWSDRARDLQSWVDALGADTDRRRVTMAEINAVLRGWRTTLAASTVNHRRDALSSLYKTLDGDGLPRSVVRFREPPDAPRHVPLDRIDACLALCSGVTKIRLTLLRWTGMRPSQMARLTVESFRPDRVIVPAGKGGRVIVAPLVCDDAKRAAAAFVACKAAFGKWSNSSARKMLHAAAEKVGVDPFSVYAIRHSWAYGLRESGADLADVSVLLGHRSLTTTKRYAPTVDAKLVAAVKRMATSHGRDEAPWPPNLD